MAENLEVIEIIPIVCNEETTGLQNTASDCSSGGKGSEVLFYFYIWNVIRYTVYPTFIPSAKVQKTLQLSKLFDLFLFYAHLKWGRMGKDEEE